MWMLVASNMTISFSLLRFYHKQWGWFFPAFGRTKRNRV
ncbi:hypothetical protein BRO54_3785 [Geobacillus proteiniphilus]|uniref:Uncharacterized protein n=1 Tax=Geobacillus proteiniphilus TaxID=860353 RepID=A0A1Q5SIV5_9BACL|nr:hypothetical protein BRO54_3785 [Geobacillus proteiniphilus]